MGIPDNNLDSNQYHTSIISVRHWNYGPFAHPKTNHNASLVDLPLNKYSRNKLVQLDLLYQKRLQSTEHTN